MYIEFSGCRKIRSVVDCAEGQKDTAARTRPGTRSCAQACVCAPEKTEEIWREFHERLRAFILSSVRNEPDTEDILQEVFLRIHKGVHTLKDEGKIRSWIYQLVRNTITDYYRARGGGQPPAEPVGLSADPSDTNEVVQKVAACLGPMIDGLAEPYRQALLRTEFAGRTQREAAEEFGISLSGMKSRVQRAREQLRDLLLTTCHLEFDRRGAITQCWPQAPQIPRRSPRSE